MEKVIKSIVFAGGKRETQMSFLVRLMRDGMIPLKNGKAGSAEVLRKLTNGDEVAVVTFFSYNIELFEFLEGLAIGSSKAIALVAMGLPLRVGDRNNEAPPEREEEFAEFCKQALELAMCEALLGKVFGG